MGLLDHLPTGQLAYLPLGSQAAGGGEVLRQTGHRLKGQQASWLRHLETMDLGT